MKFSDIVLVNVSDFSDCSLQLPVILTSTQIALGHILVMTYLVSYQYLGKIYVNVRKYC